MGAVGAGVAAPRGGGTTATPVVLGGNGAPTTEIPALKHGRAGKRTLVVAIRGVARLAQALTTVPTGVVVVVGRGIARSVLHGTSTVLNLACRGKPSVHLLCFSLTLCSAA